MAGVILNLEFSSSFCDAWIKSPRENIRNIYKNSALKIHKHLDALTSSDKTLEPALEIILNYPVIRGSYESDKYNIT